MKRTEVYEWNGREKDEYINAEPPCKQLVAIRKTIVPRVPLDGCQLPRRKLVDGGYPHHDVWVLALLGVGFSGVPRTTRDGSARDSRLGVKDVRSI